MEGGSNGCMGVGISICLAQSEHTAHSPFLLTMATLSSRRRCLGASHLPMLLVNSCVLRPGDNGFLDPFLTPDLRPFPAFGVT